MGSDNPLDARLADEIVRATAIAKTRLQEKADVVSDKLRQFQEAVMRAWKESPEFHQRTAQDASESRPIVLLGTQRPASIVRTGKQLREYFDKMIDLDQSLIAVLEADDCPLDPITRTNLLDLHDQFMKEYEKQFGQSKDRQV